jgi:hypothetical protein
MIEREPLHTWSYVSSKKIGLWISRRPRSLESSFPIVDIIDFITSLAPDLSKTSVVIYIWTTAGPLSQSASVFRTGPIITVSFRYIL